MGENARQAAINRYDIDYMVYEWNRVFKEVINLPKRRREPIK
jgi:hypothetical protein